VPYGPPRSGNGFDFNRIHLAATLLRRSVLVAGDFAMTLRHVERNDFVYLDPPYAVANRRIFSQYHESPFGVTDLARLGAHLETIDKVGAHFVISYADSREARKLLAGWKPRRVRTQRHIAGFAGDRRYAYEIIATNIRDLQHGN
jgi:DNA adenine methylase